jgi:preprotein translocase subunit YajC
VSHLTAVAAVPSLVLASGSKSSGFGNYVLPILLAVAVVVMFTASRRNRRRQADTAQSVLVPGTEIITTAGMHGTVVQAGDDVVTIEIAPGVTVKMLPGAIRAKNDPRFQRARGRAWGGVPPRDQTGPTEPPSDNESPKSGTD